ncbi:MAG TPA: nuclear transport factor 2 family protein [Chryseolinea sp.]|nr:nuclear transport factor 2 family protein [Chryseolinea sp.]
MKTPLTFCAVLLLLGYPSMAQKTMPPDEASAILRKDSTFWLLYNNCQIESMRDFFTEDLEFYHDMGGVTKGVDQLLETSRKNLCSNDNFRLRRDVVSGSTKLYPMFDGDKLYGAVLTGEHVFYIIENGNKPRLDGLAKFSHLFLKTDAGWKMARVFSYSHGPAPYLNQRKEIKLSHAQLKHYVGEYQAPDAGKCTVKESHGLLLLAIGEKTYTLHPESDTLFFQADRDLTFEFLNGKMIVREFEKIVEEAVKVN